ncbi:NAD(P)/FAD-dependent oxidoreductase [Actinomadura decatromicini]|uniref:NAD(P)/FAD-dependent oxidoreductase n=1 Tax=Actinomadura decatromicini TaxID=2604572 RepID=UPI001FEA1B87|nr:FAD-binding oxidoreductase [Actinomadura decatromicini]
METAGVEAEVVVVGGGVMGTSIAFHLAEAGVRGVVLVERDELGSGSTCKAAGGVRAQFSDEVNIRLGARSLEAFGRFGERPGQEIDLRRVGYLFLLSRPEDVASFEAGVALQNELGVPSRMVSAAEARRLSPLVDAGGLLGAAFSPDDGHCTPESVVLGYATGARRHGATIRTHCEVLGIETDGGEVTAVETSRGRIATSAVVCAAGPWSAAVGRMAGVDLPVEPLRRQIVFTEPIPGLPRPVPMTIDFTTTFYFHGEGEGLMLGMSDPDEEPGFALDRSDAWLPRLTAAIASRAPSLLDVGLTGGWAGLYEVTPDHNALIGEDASVSRFLYATGFSGHGFLQGPAVGEVVRDLYLGREPFADVGPLHAARFTGDGLRPELNRV